MKTFSLFAVCLIMVGMINIARAIDLKESKVTQVVNDVQIISASSQSARPAVVDEAFTIPDILRTGKASRAELVAKDETVTRVGADTIFSFDPAKRTIDLKQGSLLFHSPHGKGGGTIRTGSATASVLGTTLIVTTTKNGGMKVIALEGKVQVGVGGNSQKLLPGQMTFILPGGRQLAPIIVFRLDELVRNSLLVEGFSHPLPSLPLIQDQIKLQGKLLKSGKAKDTGLLVGDSASLNQVEVIDPNSIQGAQRKADPQAALRSDAKITGPSVTDSKIPTPPRRIFFSPEFALKNSPFFAGQKFRGFAGRNITFESPVPLQIDLSKYTTKGNFSFVGSGNMFLNSSASFNGLASSSVLALVGGQNIFFAPEITLVANLADFQISTPGPITMDRVTIGNSVGQITLNSGTTINLENIRFYPVGTTTFTAPEAVNFSWTSDGYLGKFGNNDDNVIITDPATGHVNISAVNGSLTVKDTSIQTHFLTLNSGDSILLDAQGRTLTTGGTGAMANFNAPNLVTVQNADLSGFSLVNMVANTIVVRNTTFGSDGTYNFGTGTGLASINGPVVNGRLNLINDRIGTVAITDLSQINFTAGPGNGPGIYSYKK